ncbi:MAG: sigma-54-dependent Fis family transcriptional regulator [bacterium]|nr:sigma-54-dependent Fis family transcriptional regulator [bacterium]
MSKEILIVDDERNIRRSLRGIFEDENLSVEDVESGEEAVKHAEENFYKVIFLDVLLPGIDGIQTLKKLKKITPGSTIIMMSGHANVEMAIDAIKFGAYNFFEKPLIPEKILLELKHIDNLRKIEAEVIELRKVAGWDDIIGDSGKTIDLKKLIARIAPTESRVLITGENGTGKELVARAIHYNSNRKNGPFVKVNCAALPKDLIESELFGYEKGAFTGAAARKTGRFEEANNGTLLLDEIGDMSLDTQAKLLRVLEENELIRLGGNKTIELNVRIISATNQDLEDLIEKDRFREDLLYRLNTILVEVPPLRDRREDIPVLALHFAEQFAEKNGKMKIGLDNDAAALLQDQPWRGNIRELKNVIERIAIMTDSIKITANEIVHLLPGVKPVSKGAVDIEPNDRSLREMIDNYEKAILTNEYDKCRGNVSKLAGKLKIDRANLHRKLKLLGLK